VPPTPLGKFRLIALVEGCSFMLLVCVGMPLKYLAKIPEPNQVIGYAHGGLFFAYCVLLAWAARSRRWPHWWSGVAFAASLLPIGTFLLDPSLRRELKQERESASVEPSTR
jgi:integral membrane protein